VDEVQLEGQFLREGVVEGHAERVDLFDLRGVALAQVQEDAAEQHHDFK
jgi:hypothetical protein